MTKDTWKKEITEAEYLQLVGLIQLGSHAYKRMKEVDEAMADIIEYHSEWSGVSAGLLSDEYFNDSPNIKNCLKDMGIKVKKNGHKTKH